MHKVKKTTQFQFNCLGLIFIHRSKCALQPYDMIRKRIVMYFRYVSCAIAASAKHPPQNLASHFTKFIHPKL